MAEKVQSYFCLRPLISAGIFDSYNLIYESFHFFQALIELDRISKNEDSPIDFAQNVVTDKAIREASVAADKKLSLFGVDIAMKKDIFDNICAFSDRIGTDKLTTEQKRYVKKSIVNGKRYGLHLDEATRDKVKEVKKKISELGTQFRFNLNEDTSFLFFDLEELAGVPQDLVDSFEKVFKKTRLKSMHGLEGVKNEI
jgi:Zn-dependent oligopeptidase